MMERRSLRGSAGERGYISRHYVWAESSCLRTGLRALTQVGQRRQLLADVWNDERRFEGNAACVMGRTAGGVFHLSSNQLSEKRGC